MVCRWRKGWSSRCNRAGSAKFGSNFWASRFLAPNCPHQHHSFKSLQIWSKTFVSVRLKLKIDLRRSSAVVCLLISGWDEGSFHVTILHDKVSYKKHFFPPSYTNHSSLVVALACDKSWPMRDLRFTDGRSMDVVSKHRLKFLGIVWLPLMPFSPIIIFSDGKRVVWSRGRVECFEPFVAFKFVW